MASDSDRIEQLVVMVLEAVDQRLQTALGQVHAEIAAMRSDVDLLRAHAASVSPIAIDELNERVSRVERAAVAAGQRPVATPTQAVSTVVAHRVAPPEPASTASSPQLHDLTATPQARTSAPPPPAIAEAMGGPFRVQSAATPPSFGDAGGDDVDIDVERLTSLITKQLSHLTAD